MSDKKRKILKAIILIIFILLVTFAAAKAEKNIIKYFSNPDILRAMVDSASLKYCMIYIISVIFQIIFAVLPGEPFEIIAGYAFGALKGSIICIFAEFAGSIIVFFLVRKFGMRLCELFFSREKLENARFLKRSRKKDILFSAIFIMPGTPKDLMCYYAGLTDMKAGAWIIISSLGRIPSVLTSTIGGDALFDKNYVFAISVFAITLILSIAGILIYDAMSKRKKSDK